ncbi:BQ2448_2778 [Microbotryum intermedium]|uniref:BQ2448_2778 protein n=1 Tax=Microbotryum intermedium TaxID=269621 RepID=A0A238FBG7_9BASI|nr:BQ2448_2778 [Microbotryum intermedium]
MRLVQPLGVGGSEGGGVGGDRNSRTYIVIRVVLAIAFNKLYLARWHRHKDQTPLPAPYLLAREVRSHLKFRLRRLPDGELLE